MQKLSVLILLFAFIFSQSYAQGTLEVQVTNVDSEKGRVLFMVFSESSGFPTKIEKAYKVVRLSPKIGQMTYTFRNLPFGNYAVSIAHDSNENGKVDTNFIGIPRERVGASNQTTFGKPSFNKSRISLNRNQKSKKVVIKFIN